MADTVHHDRREFLRDKGRHPMYFLGKIVGAAERSRQHQRPPFLSVRRLAINWHTHPCPRELGREQSTVTDEQVGKELSITPRGGPQAAGT